MEMMKYKISAGGYLIALENKGAMECYLEENIKGTTMMQMDYRTLASSELHTETMDQLVSLPWRAVSLHHFEEEKRITPKVHALIATPSVKTVLQLRLAWCMTRLQMG